MAERAAPSAPSADAAASAASAAPSANSAEPAAAADDGYDGFSSNVVASVEEVEEIEEEALAVPFRNLDTGQVLSVAELPTPPLALGQPRRDRTTSDDSPLPVRAGSASGSTTSTPRGSPLPGRSSPYEKCTVGYLWKRSRKVGLLHKRWYVLSRSGGLRYYASAQESIRAPQQLRQVPLDGVRVIQSPEALHGLLHAGPLSEVGNHAQVGFSISGFTKSALTMPGDGSATFPGPGNCIECIRIPCTGAPISVLSIDPSVDTTLFTFLNSR